MVEQLPELPGTGQHVPGPRVTLAHKQESFPMYRTVPDKDKRGWMLFETLG